MSVLLSPLLKMKYLRYTLLIMLCYKIGCEGLLSSHMHGPSFVEEPPPSQDYTNSSGVILNCNGQGNPPPEIRWTDSTNREIMHIPRFREILPNGSLYIMPFVPGDFRVEVHTTVYKCVLSNVVGSITSRECKIKAEIMHDVDIQVQNVFASRGNVAVLKCNTPSPIKTNLLSVTWFQDDGKSSISKIIQAGGRYIETFSGELHIRDVTDEDSEIKFYCQVTNRLTGERYTSQPGHIIVTNASSNYPPRIDYFSPNVHVRVGNAVELVCVADGYPPPVYRWYYEVSGALQEIRSGAAVFVRAQSSVLQFPRVQLSDSARYVCVVSNMMGEDRREMRLSVLSPLIAFIRPQKQVVDSGSQAVFNCSVQGGIGDASILWLKDGKQLYGNAQFDILNKGETLIISSVSRNDRGMYQCYARNMEDTAQASAELILGAVMPEFESTFFEETIQPGLPISLRCSADGNPPPRFVWFLDGSQVQVADGFIIGSFLDSKGSVISHLNISSTKLQHGGQYTCMAHNFLGSIQHSSMINIYGPPLARPPINVTAVSGMSVSIRCPVSGFPVLSTSWYYESNLLPINHRQKVYPNGTLLLTNLEEEKDQGKLTCTVQNQHEQMATGTIFLNIMSPPEIMPFHFSSNLKENGKAHVACTVVSGDLPITFTWRKNGKPITNDPDIHEQILQMVSTLLINNLTSRHTGLYTCIASNPAASSNYTAKLVVKASPVWQMEPQDTTVLYHQSVTIDCQAGGYPEPRISWLKTKDKQSDENMKIDSDTGLLLHSNGSFSIQLAEKQHEGFYRCQAHNGIGTISKVISVKVNIPAHFRLKILNQSGIAGHSLTLACEAEGDFPLRVTWNNQPLALTPQIRHSADSLISELHVERLSKEHAGIYRCTASNSFGYDHMTIHLTVKEPPQAPNNLEVIELGSRWISLNWTSNNNDDLYYVIQTRRDGDENWTNSTSSGTKQSAQVNSLLPNTNYDVRMIAINEVGNSLFSDILPVRTLQEAPNAYPTDLLLLRFIDLNGAIIQWKPAQHSEQWNSEILGYKVVYNDKNSNQTYTKTVKGSHKTETSINHLKYYTTYEIVVKAFNQIGDGPGTPIPLKITTVESVPVEAPQNIYCLPISAEALKIKWDPPPKHYWNGILQSYKITYRLSSPKFGSKLQVMNKKAAGLETDVYNLDKFTEYTIRVSASTNSGEGPPSAPVQCATMEDSKYYVPGAPEHIKAIVVTSDRILLTWTSPNEPNGKITKYNIYMKRGAREEPKKESIPGNSNRKHEFRHLLEDQSYEFWVTASSGIGEGQSSMRILQRPISRVPARIASFSTVLMGVYGRPLTLECNAIGLPAATSYWQSSFGNVTMSGDIRILPDNSLHIHSLTRENALNYSCFAENVFGKDYIQYTIIGVEKPKQPILSQLTADHSTVLISWKNMGDGASPITGYVIDCFSQSEVKRSVFVDPDLTEYTFHQLKCGTSYSFTIQALNSVGASPKSSYFNITTKGKVPEVANENDIMFINSTAVTLYLDGWPENDCPITHFTISYKYGEKWIPYGNEYLSSASITINKLIPATLYTVRIDAYNSAGKTSNDYVFVTRSLNGEIIPIELISQQRGKSLTNQLNLIIPIISSVICILSLLICAFVLIQRRKIYGNYNKSEQTTIENSKAEIENQQNANHQKHIYPSPTRTVTYKDNSCKGQKTCELSDEYDVYPYATFSVTNQLNTFGQRNDISSNEQHTIQRRKKISTPKVSNDTLEIMCISNQPTLPLARKDDENLTINKSFTPQKDGVNCNVRHKKQYIRNNSDYNCNSNSSSTESRETSPEIARRSKTRHTSSSSSSR